MDNSIQDQLSRKLHVKETLKESSSELNEPLYNHIYYERKLNINKLAIKINVNRQYVWGILHRRMQVSFTVARKICDILGVKEIQTLFRQSDIYYPSFQTADTLLLEKKKNDTDNKQE